MSKVSQEFGDLISSFLRRNGLTFRAAAFKSGISAAYWKDMSDGRVPSDEVIGKIASCFDDLNENDLRAAAGYALDPDKTDAVTAVSIALRHHKDISDEGKRQIIEFVKEIQQRYKTQEARQ